MTIFNTYDDKAIIVQHKVANNNHIINNNNHDNIYIAVIMTRSLRLFTRFIW